MWPFGRGRASRPNPASPWDLLEERVVLLTGAITDPAATTAIAQLLYLQDLDPRRPITLRIDSPGGSLSAGMAVLDTVRFLGPAVHTEATAEAGGVSAVILAGGRKGERVVGAAAEVTLVPLTGAYPDVDLGQARRRLTDVMAELTGQPAAAVEADLLDGRSFTPEEAVAYGLADRVGV